MEWTSGENVSRIVSVIKSSSEKKADLCIFPELALTGFHREIEREAVPVNVALSLKR